MKLFASLFWIRTITFLVAFVILPLGVSAKEASSGEVTEQEANLPPKVEKFFEAQHLSGLGLYRKSFLKMESAADDGLVQAMVEVGNMHWLGLGALFPSDKRAVQWWEQAAALGHASAHYNLSIAYKMGLGVEKDKELRLRHLEAAASANPLNAE